MEKILLDESRIPPRVTLLKPLSSAIAIGTGGPFGAEGPIIATGGALGSLLGQLLRVTAAERKTLLAAGAAAGMAAIFAAPVSAVILAVELLLFELRPRSLLPVALATVTAAGVRDAMLGSAPVFPMPAIVAPGLAALAFYVALGAFIGLASVGITRAVYAVEDAFERLPIHWMWWPALGGVVIGVIGYLAPRTLGVGYVNIDDIISGRLAMGALGALAAMKFLSWVIALGSGTSGGTLAPLFTIGGALGGVIGCVLAAWVPALGIDPRIAGLVGMAAMFAGASRALLTSIIFALETTQQPLGLLPLLGSCSAAFLVSGLFMRNTIMTEKIVRRGVRVPVEYSADYLDQIDVGRVYNSNAVSLRADETLEATRNRMRSGDPNLRHHGYPIVDASGQPCGVLTLRDLLDPDANPQALLGDLVWRPPLTVYPDETLREAADRMALTGVGRLLVVERGTEACLLGLLTRGDLVGAHAQRLHEFRAAVRHLRLRLPPWPAR
jgi:H+/Cl- antiporter ClcA